MSNLNGGNWYKRYKIAAIPQSRYYAKLSASVFVPIQQDKEKEKDSAYYVLNKYLPATNDASYNSGLHSSVVWKIEEIVPYV